MKQKRLLSQTAWQRPSFGRILPDLVAFTIGLGTAWYLDWQTADLVWSLWLCSLVLGYLTILSTIGAGVYLGARMLFHEESPKKKRLPAILIGSAVALFLLAFFSFHFCGFHSGHATFLSFFFPLKELPKNAFADSFMNPFLLWKTVFKHLLPVYGLFLIPTIIAERQYVFANLIAAVKAVQAGPSQGGPLGLIAPGKGGKKGPGDPFFRPYINVIRMHILIFFFAFSQMLKVNPFFIYSVVYFVYFFPWTAFRTAPANQ